MNDLIVDEIKFTALKKSQVDKIKNRLPEFLRVSNNVGHSHSQTSYSLQTMSRFRSPTQKMKQCIIQINKRYGALREAYFAVEEKKLKIKELMRDNTESSILKIADMESLIPIIHRHMETAFREIGYFQDMYDSLKKSNNVSEDWTEKDLENQEIEHMIKSAFHIAIENIMTYNAVNRGAIDWFVQVGINPILAEKYARNYVTKTRNDVKEKDISIKPYHDFLDRMYDKFKDSYKDMLDYSGIENIISEDFLGRDVNHGD